MTHDENRISDLIDGGIHDKSDIDRAKYELHMRQKVAIEEAAKLPTDEIFYEGELNEKRITAYKKLADNYGVQEGTVRDIFSQGIAFACTHTQAHTERLRERVKELEEAIEYLYMCFKRDGIVASDFDKAKKAMRKEALK